MEGGNSPKYIEDLKFILLFNALQKLISLATLNSINSNDNGTLLIGKRTILPNASPAQMANSTIIVHGTGTEFIY